MDISIRRDGSKRVQLSFDQVDDLGNLLLPSLTKQSFSHDTDINAIMARYEKTGIITHANEFKGSYGDFTDVQDYDVSLRQVMAAQDAFMSLPAQLRARFENDPGQFLDFVGDPANAKEMETLGLLNSVVSQPIDPVTDGPLEP